MQAIKPLLSFRQIINMNVGFFGIQYSFGLQQTAINPLYGFLNALPEETPILNLAGPVTGLIIQPIIGALSDKTWHPKWGRRKPYFLIGAIFCSICLFLFPFSSALWMAVGLLWILDAANNTAMEPYRAFIADKLPPSQLALGFLTQSFFTGFGITLANISLYLFQQVIRGGTEAGIPYWVFGSFFVGAICSIASVLWSVTTTPEIPPTKEELDNLKSERRGIFYPLIEIASAIRHMPKTLWKLALVYLFQWYAMFCYWQFISHSLARTIWNTSVDTNKELYEEAVGWTGLVNGWYNIVTFLSAFALVSLSKRFSAKWVHISCLMLAGLSLIIVAFIDNRYLVFIPMIGLGIAWASMMGVPYIMIVSSIPPARYGVYMGIVNMMIVIPMMLQTLSFGFVYKNFLGAHPPNAIIFAGVFLVLAALATIRIRKDTVQDVNVGPAIGGH